MWYAQSILNSQALHQTNHQTTSPLHDSQPTMPHAKEKHIRLVCPVKKMCVCGYNLNGCENEKCIEEVHQSDINS